MTSPPDDLAIGDDQIVVRRVHIDHHSFDEHLGRRRPSTQAFLQNGRNGLTSVYLLSETTPAAVAAGGREPYQCAVSVAVLRENGLGIIRTPGSGGPGHCDITGRKTKSRLNRIVSAARWVPGYAPPSAGPG